MINEYFVKNYCNEDISLIENYGKAIADSTQMWDCHHRRENISSRKELLELGEYYSRPARELIFLTHSEHSILHKKGKHHTEEAKQKISIALKGKTTWMKGKHHTEEAKQKISIALKGKTTWNKGKHMSEETKRKMSEARKGKTTWNKGKHHSEEAKQKMASAKQGLHWFNNGIKNVFVKECPEGFVKGRLKKVKQI